VALSCHLARSLATTLLPCCIQPADQVNNAASGEWRVDIAGIPASTCALVAEAFDELYDIMVNDDGEAPHGGVKHWIQAGSKK